MASLGDDISGKAGYNGTSKFDDVDHSNSNSALVGTSKSQSSPSYIPAVLGVSIALIIGLLLTILIVLIKKQPR